MDNLINRELRIEGDREDNMKTDRERFLSSAGSAISSSAYTTNTTGTLSVSSATNISEVKYPQHPYQNSSILMLNNNNSSQTTSHTSLHSSPRAAGSGGGSISVTHSPNSHGQYNSYGSVYVKWEGATAQNR